MLKIGDFNFLFFYNTPIFSADAPLVGIRPGILLIRGRLAAGGTLVGICPGLLLVEAGLTVGTLVSIRPGLLFSGCIAAMGSAPLCQLSQTTADKVPRKGSALGKRPARRSRPPRLPRSQAR